ncbi:hypothetical protein MMC14_007844 [Varicellaria rhodocarpa]|nr:hypothetical protein [Varicellaria rhodocarpa]
MNYYKDYQLSFCHGTPEYISYEQPKPFPFLDLPGELRNKIYRMCLVGPSQYTVNLRFPPRTASSLLCVNKQVFLEASSIFYAENVFRFPATLFTSSSAPNMIEQVCGIRPETLQMMKRFVLHIPIHGFQHDHRVRQLTGCNLDAILGFIYQWNGDKLLVQLNYELAWPNSWDSTPWSSMISVLRVLKSSHSNIQIEVNVETPWMYLEASMDILHQLYDRNWTMIVDRGREGLSWSEQMLRDYALAAFREMYLRTPGLGEFYTEEVRNGKSIFRPAKREDGFTSLSSRLFPL